MTEIGRETEDVKAQAKSLSAESDRRSEIADALNRRGDRDTVSPEKRGRPKNRWRIRVVRIDAQKYAEHRDRDHPFASMAAEARTREIDAFCARLWLKTRMPDAAAAATDSPESTSSNGQTEAESFGTL